MKHPSTAGVTTVLVISFALSACASSANPPVAQELREERQYLTGSNIPSRDREARKVDTMSREAMEQAARNVPSVGPKN